MISRRSLALAGIATMTAASLATPPASADVKGSSVLSSLSSVSSQSSLWREATLRAGFSITEELTLRALKFGPTTAAAAEQCAARHGDSYNWQTADCSNTEITQQAYVYALTEIPVHWNILSTGNDAVPLKGSS